MNARRDDAHRKIVLGGLVIKSGMDGYPPSVILGVLSLAMNRIKGPDGDAALERFREAGDYAFSRDQEGGGKRS